MQKNESSLWSTQNIHATLLLVFNSEVIKFKLVFAKASPAEHIADIRSKWQDGELCRHTHTHTNTMKRKKIVSHALNLFLKLLTKMSIV